MGPFQDDPQRRGPRRPMPMITPQRRQKLRRRSERIARREMQPVLDAFRKQQAQLKRRRDSEVGSFRAATNMINRGLAQQQAGLENSGLKGQFLKQTAQELGARQADMTAALPGLTAGVRREYRQGRKAVRQDMADARVDRSEAAQSVLADLLEQTRARKTAKAEEQATTRLAHREAVTLLKQIPEQERSVLHSNAAWFELEKQVRGMEGVDPETARQIIADLRRRVVPTLPSNVLTDAERRAAVGQ